MKNKKIIGSFTFLIMVLLIVPQCFLFAADTLPKWRRDEMRRLQDRWDRIQPDIVLHLSDSKIASIGDQVYLGGSYRTSAASYRSVLLKSNDGGRSWKELDIWMSCSEVDDIFFYDEDHHWFITCWSIEGAQAPYHVFRSQDGGESWTRSKRSLPNPNHIETSLSFIRQRSFQNPRDGVMSFLSTTGILGTYTTHDGGINWRLLKSEKIDPDEIYNREYVKSKIPGIPKNKKKSDSKTIYKTETDWRNGLIFIHSSEDSGETWKKTGWLPYYYKFKGETTDVIPK